jgi:hypothetical protein
MPQPALIPNWQLTWAGDDAPPGPSPNTRSVAALPPLPEIEKRANN